MKHYHTEISYPACMPEYEQAFATAYEAIEDLKQKFDDVEYDLRVYSDPLLVVLTSPDKPNLLNCFVKECDEAEHVIEYQLFDVLQKGAANV